MIYIGNNTLTTAKSASYLGNAGYKGVRLKNRSLRMKNRLYQITLLTALLPLQALSDEVAIHSGAISDLMQLQEYYSTKASLSEETIRDYSALAAIDAGRKASCENLTTEELSEITEGIIDDIVDQSSDIIEFLITTWPNISSAPTRGFIRNEFLASFGKGCRDKESDESTTSKVKNAMVAIENILILQKEIDYRRKEVIRLIKLRRSN